MTAGPLHTRHFTIATAGPPEMTGRISTDGVVAELDVVGDELVAQITSTVSGTELELLQQRVHGDRAVDLDLAPRVAQQHLHPRKATGLLRAADLADLESTRRA